MHPLHVEPSAGITEEVLSRALAGEGTAYDWLARSVALRAGTVLDIACGSGAMSRRLENGSRTVIGLDLSGKELAEAAERSPGPWVQGDALALPFADASVDAVVTVMGLAVIHPTNDLLTEVARVLRPGGIFAAIAPTWRPVNWHDIRVGAGLHLRLQSHATLRHAATRSSQQLPPIGLSRQLASHGLRKVEDARERYRFVVSNREDAELIVAAMTRSRNRARRVQKVVDWLAYEAQMKGSVQIPLPMRRIMAIR